MQWIRDEHGNQPQWVQPLTDPSRWVPAAQATHMRPEDPVLGLQIDDGAWALP